MTNSEPDRMTLTANGVTVTIDVSEVDGTPIVFVDTDDTLESPGGPLCRVRLNDNLIYGQSPFNEES